MEYGTLQDINSIIKRLKGRRSKKKSKKKSKIQKALLVQAVLGIRILILKYR